MLPSAHVELTWAAANAIARRSSPSPWDDVDYRLLALAAILPDLIDKPLAIFAFPDSRAALLFGHTLLAQAIAWGLAGARGQVTRRLPYLLAFSGHLVADRMWGFSQTLVWPLKGLRFHQWKDVGSPQAFVRAYVDIVLRERKLLLFEAAGLALLGWFVSDR
jgi:hypothetical protein